VGVRSRGAIPRSYGKGVANGGVLQRLRDIVLFLHHRPREKTTVGFSNDSGDKEGGKSQGNTASKPAYKKTTSEGKKNKPRVTD